MCACVRVCVCACMCACVRVRAPTDEEVRGAVLLQEGVQVVPQLGHPVQHPDEVLVGQALLVLGLHQLAVEVAHQEAVGWLHVVGERHHPGPPQGAESRHVGIYMEDELTCTVKPREDSMYY